MYIPFCPVPVNEAKKIVGNTFYGVSETLVKIFPNLENELKQADLDIGVRDYLSVSIFSSSLMFLSTFFAFLLVSMQLTPLQKAFPISILVASFFFISVFFYIRIYPKLIIRKRIADIERNLLYAIRHIYVQVTSGVPVFDALSSVSQANYGALSSEFKIAVRNINTGVPIERALDDIARRNPSQYFRRALWQISNGIKSGSDIGNTLKNIVDYISSEQRILIKRYGSQLNPLTLAYMMIAVVIPSLGITFLIVLSSFSRIPVTETMFWFILGFIALFQFMFLGMIKSKRPNLI